MTIEFVGSLVSASPRSPESPSGAPAPGLGTDPDYPVRMASLHEESGFDRLLVGGKHADVYAFRGEPLATIAERIAAVRAAASPYGRSPRFSVSLRPIAAATQERARDRAYRILEVERARTTTAAGRSTALVGSYQQVAEALLDYVALGVSTLLISGYDLEADAADYASIITLVREQADGHRSPVA